MQRQKLLFTLTLIAASCAEPSDQGLIESTGGDGGTGAAGKAGAASKDGGRSGTGGTSGAGGTSGKGGSVGAQTDGGAGTKDGGSAGKSGAGGTTGTGGSVGSGGTVGTAGTTGTGGNAGTVGTAGSSTGGTNGAGGIAGGATGGSGGAPPTAGFYCSYKVEERNNGTAIGSELWIVNNSAASIALNQLKLRYYLTNEATLQIMQRINWGNLAPLAGGSADQIQGEITITPPTRLQTPVAGADSYVEFGFSSSRMLPVGSRVQFSWTVHNNASQPFTQTNDYSFNGSMTSVGNWDKVVLFQDQTVLWGVVP